MQRRINKFQIGTLQEQHFYEYFFQHATIFFDQYSRVYELINYSDHGTIVDNIIYTLNPISCAANGKEVSNLHSNSSSNIHAAGINNNTADPHSEKGGQSTGKKSSLGKCWSY